MKASPSLSHAGAIALQKQLSPQPIRYLAGVDVGFQDNSRVTQAAIAVLSFPDIEKIESAIAQCPTTFPYILPETTPWADQLASSR